MPQDLRALLIPFTAGSQALALRVCPTMREGHCSCYLPFPSPCFSALGPSRRHSVPVFFPMCRCLQNREGVGMNPRYLPPHPMSEQGTRPLGISEVR